jgi:ribonuclease VapC
MSGLLVDASVLLAVVLEAKGSDQIASFLAGAAISAVNLAEAAAKLAERGLTDRQIRYVIAQTRVQPVSFSEPHAIMAGCMRSQTSREGLSLADRACLATAKVEGWKVLTADRAWLGLAGKLGVEIESIR